MTASAVIIEPAAKRLHAREYWLNAIEISSVVHPGSVKALGNRLFTKENLCSLWMIDLIGSTLLFSDIFFAV